MPSQALVTLSGAPGDPDFRHPDYQRELIRVSMCLGDVETLYAQWTLANEAGGKMAYATGLYVVPFSFLTGAVVAAAVRGWLMSRRGRSVRLEVDGIELQAYSRREIDEWVGKVIELKTRLEWPG